MVTKSGVLTLEKQLKQKLTVRAKSGFYLQNPHLWADERIGIDLYEKHTLRGSKWQGWGEQQITFLRDITDLRVTFQMGICNRGGSKTWLTAVGLCCLLDNVRGIRASVLSGSFKQAKTCYKYARDILNKSGMSLKLAKQTTMAESQLIGGGELSVLTASEHQTRAPRTDVLILDEACQIKNSLITSFLPQSITAIDMKIVILTTPNDLNHEVKRWWDMAKRLGMVLHQWGANHCAWIPKKNVDFFRMLLDENTFRIEIMGEWGSASGAVFSYAKIQKALCDMNDLPPLTEMDKFYAGIDWGMAHPTVIIILGMRGSFEEGTDEWFVYYVQAWKQTDMDAVILGGYRDLVGKIYTRKEVKEQGLNPQTLEYIWGIKDVIDFYKADTYSEQSPISAFANRKLRKSLSDVGVSFRTDSFSRKKNTMVNNLKGCLEHERIKIPKTFRVLISQLQSYSYKMVNEEIREEFKKINDDYTDAIVWARWHEHIDLGDYIEIGELEGLDNI